MPYHLAMAPYIYIKYSDIKVNIPNTYFLANQETQFASLDRGAEDEIRTRDVHLGKVTLYH